MNVRSAVVWVGLVFLSPFIGSFLYLILGVNRIHRAAIKRRQCDRSVTSFERSVARWAAPDEALTERSTTVQIGAKMFTPGAFTVDNSIEPLVNGDEAFPAMLEAIGGAKRSVALMTYIFESRPSRSEVCESPYGCQAQGSQGSGSCRRRGDKVQQASDRCGLESTRN